MRRSILRVAGGLMALTLTGLSMSAARADSAADARRSADIAKPSVVLVQFKVQGYVNDNRDGKTYGPFGYTGLGTGFFVSDNGYVVTAAHVAAPSDDYLKATLVEQYLTQDARETTTCVVDGNCQSLIDGHRNGYLLASSLTQVTKDIQVFTQDQNVASADTTGLTAEVKGSSATVSHDTAVLKVNANNTPALALADSDKVETQDPLTVIGYPGDTLESTSLKTALVPTITKGSVTAKKQGDASVGIAADVNVFQTDAAITHGNSGGPAVDSTGKVVGLVSFGASASSTNSSFLITSNDIRDVVKSTGADTTFGKIDGLWRDGLGLMDKRYYTSAKKDFDQCVALNKVQVGCAEQAAKAGGLLAQDQEPADIAAAKARESKFPTGLVVGLVLAVIVIVGALAAMLMSRKKTVAAPSGGPYMNAPPAGGLPYGGVPGPQAPGVAAPSPQVQPYEAPPAVHAPAPAPPDVRPSAPAPAPRTEPPPPSGAAAAPPAPAVPDAAFAPAPAVPEEAPLASSFCTSCGTPLGGARFCGSCGTKV